MKLLLYSRIKIPCPDDGLWFIFQSMKAYGKLINGSLRSVLTDDRGHEVLSDVGQEFGGEDTAPSALELTALSLAGCLTTIWGIVAKNSGVSYTDFEVEIDAEKDSPMGTICKARATARVSSGEDRVKLEKCFEKVLKSCPVGQIWEKAGIDLTEELVIRD
ncbi:MAG: OsmC family protein [Spirochaetales bacterium]|nr:OsmC family protein [Spirochaetales bacterium]